MSLPGWLERWRSSRGAATALTLAVLWGVTLAIYWGVWRFDFVAYDDPEYVAANPHVQGGLSLAAAQWAFTTGYFSYWHPLTWLSHQLDVTCFGPGPAGPHAVNLVLHLANAALVFLLLRRATGAWWRSAAVAAWFAWHPLHVESVAWIAERKDLLSTGFALLSLLTYVRAAANEPSRAWWGRGGYWASLALFAGALLSKPMVVMLPFVMLLLDHWPLRRRGWSTLLAEKIPFAVLSLVVAAITLHTQQQNQAVESLASFSLLDRAANALVAYASYVVKTLWPTRLAFFYPHPGRWPWSDIVASAAVLAGIGLVAWRGRARCPFGWIGWAWFLVVLVPAIGVVQVGVQAMADRYSYFSSLGLFVVLAWGGAEFVARWPRWRAMTIGAAGLATAACVVVAGAQVPHWRSNDALCRRALAVTRDNFVAHNNLANDLVQRGEFDAAITHYEQAISLRPEFPSPHSNLGMALLQLGRAAAAIPHLRRALELEPRFAEVHNNLATALRQNGELEAAAASYRRAVGLRPEFAVAWHNLGTLSLQRGAVDEGIAHLQRAAALAPDDSAVRGDLGFALAQAGRAAEACDALAAVLRLDADHVPALAQLAWLRATWPDATIRRGAEAVTLAERARQLTQGRVPRVLRSVAAAYAEVGRLDEAIAVVRRAQELTASAAGSADESERVALAAALEEQLRYHLAGAPFREPPVRASQSNFPAVGQP